MEGILFIEKKHLKKPWSHTLKKVILSHKFGKVENIFAYYTT